MPTDLSTLTPDSDGVAKARIARESKLKDVLAKYSLRTAEDAEHRARPTAFSPPGGGDGNGPPRKPAKPRPAREQHDAAIKRAREKLSRDGARLKEQERQLKAEAENHRQWKAFADATSRMGSAELGTTLAKHFGGSLRDVFERSVQQEKDPEGHKARIEDERTKRKLAELQRQVEHITREDMTRRAWSELSADVVAYQERSDMLRTVNRRELVELAAGILNENPHASPRDALMFIEERVRTARSKATPKPAPKPAAKSAAKVASAFLKKDDAAPKAKKPTSEISQFLARYRAWEKKGSR